MSASDTYISHPLNVSLSKQAHIFPKAKRFSRNYKIPTQAFYDIPSTKSKRTTSFGFGCKTSLNLKSSSPPPNTYNPPSIFEKKDLMNTTSFGPGREKVSFGSFIWEALKRTKNTPSPDKYLLPAQRIRIGGKMGERIRTDPDARYKATLPGPAAYKLDCTEMKQGNYILSTFKNSTSPRFIQSSDRLTTKRNMFASVSYDIQEKELGKYAESKFRNEVGRSFSKAKRPGLEQKCRLFVPGFKYRRFSQFGAVV